ncbi:MAG: HAMP domain-containing sensor histidine kinase [Draconibacterium sp.]
MNKYLYLVVAICFFVVAALIENNLLRKHPEKHLVSEFQNQLVINEDNLITKVERITTLVSADDFDENFFETLNEFNLTVEESGMGFLVYQSGQLVYWSDRTISFYDVLSNFKKREGLVKLPNGFYVATHLVKNEYEVIGLHLIKYNYEHENKYLQNTFYNAYKLPNDFKIVPEEQVGTFPVFDKNGTFLFAIRPGGVFLCTLDQLYLPGIIYFVGLLILLFYFRREVLESKTTFFLRLFGLATALFIVYWLHLLFEIPAVLQYLPFFSPEIFALNDWLPSLGDYFLLILFFAFWLYNFSKDLNVDEIREDSTLSRKFVVSLLLLFAASLFLLTNFFIETLVNNSTISFSLNKITGISLQSVLGIFSVGLMLSSNIFFTIKIMDEACRDFKLSHLVVVLAGIALFLTLVQLIAIDRITYAVIILFVLSALLASMFSKNYLRRLSLGSLIIFISVASVYSLVVFYHSISKKERENQKLLAVTLVAERDPAAEEFLTNIQYRMGNDAAIQSLLLQNEDPREYIERAYFNSYFRKYLFNIYICNKQDSLIINQEDRAVPCLPFMDAMISDMGVRIPRTNFYYMENMNGRISYTGKFRYPLLSDSVTVYIDLDSDLLFEGIGFPELLIDKSITRLEIFRKFNYAKYYGGELADKFGDYNYNFYIDTYQPSDSEFTYKKWDKFEHLIYHTHENNYIIVSRELFTFGEYLISFPYLFVFYFIQLLILLVIGDRNVINRRVIFDLKFKIQAAIISIVFVSLLLVALATIFYNIEQYKSKHQNDLDEKMKSIAEEIDMRMEDRDEITPDLVDWLRTELAKLSNIFRTDINIYGVDGKLLASSRDEIFQRGLVSDRINSQAYYEIFQNFQFDSYFQPEKIGQLSYLSAYKPIINNRGAFLGSINLPYFIRQDNYSQEISTFIVAFINLYVLLFLASIIVAVFIANQITRPLVVIQENLKKMQLGKRNEPIYYKRNDEIGSLVKEYNKKVDELAVSADLLARSERESAWREMAKQIAHEIKNPLTPMKLNIQYLQRTKGKNEEYNEFLERVTSTLIEQIDTLSDIATEFSNFAKIPVARNQVFVLADQLKKVIDLYETHNRAHIEFHTGDCKDLQVNADREQLSRAIINLIKNGIQAIPKGKVGTIKINLSRREHMAVIAVADNGTGIPEELQSKLFSPSFTTKTSGMGLGLSIVKNIVENFAGRIWFETLPGKGTTFFLEIPIYEKKEEV